MPGTPNPSTPGEAFMDTPIVNGTAYPYLEVEPKAYRFRILNAANDRFLNLQLYVAADKTTWTPANPATPGIPGSPTALCAATADPTDCTEVKMVPVAGQPNQSGGHAERHPRSGNERTGLDPDRHRRRLPAEAGCGTPAAHRLEPQPDYLQFRQRQSALASPGIGGAGGCRG